MKKNLLLFSVFLLFSANYAFAQTATVKEYDKVFTTYPFSDPNPIPKVGKIYPYFRFDGYTDKPVQKSWKVVELENDYIKVLILPEIGGKVWTAIEKKTGKAFIYNNQVVKFRDIAMRGPWTSGGIEANYGIIGHTPNVSTPVDYITRKNANGSVSVITGVLDLLTQTPWRIEINLPKDKAYFTTSSFWFNATNLEQPYYTWMNAGIKARGNLEFVYPGKEFLGHDGELGEWNVNSKENKDISFYENNNFGGYKSYHVFGKYTEFFGGYWHDDEFGLARVASHDDKAGKKLWIWGLSNQGMLWEKLLTDTDGQYVEVQSGRLFNQSADNSTFTPFKHRGFAPYSTDKWTEFWFPVKDTKGFLVANEFGALNLKNEKDGLKIYLSPARNINEKLEIVANGKTVYAKELKLKPLETFTDLINSALNLKDLQVLLDGKQIYSGNAEEANLSRPDKTPADFDWNSVYGLYLQGKENLRERVYDSAQLKLEECLKKDANFLPALVDLTQIYYRNMDYAKSLEMSKKALSIDTYDGGANFYYGLANLKIGRIVDAKDGFDIASMSIEFRSAAWTELSKIYFREKDLERAEIYAKKSLDFNRYNLDALQIIAVSQRLSGKKDEAAKTLSQILEFDPLNHFARFETSLWEKTPAAKSEFTKLIRNEMPQETYLDLALWYYNLGLLQDTKNILETSNKNAEVLYWQAFIAEKLGEKNTDSFIKQADSSDVKFVFPFRLETAEVLNWVQTKSQNWQPKYYSALIFYNKNNPARGNEILKSLGNTPNFAPFYALRAEKIAETAENDLRRAIALDGNEWRYGKLLTDYYLANKRNAEALETARQFSNRFPANYMLSMLYAKTLLANRKFAESDKILAAVHVLPYEGATDGRRLYRLTKLMQAVELIKANEFAKALEFTKQAREWHENLGVGKPYQKDIDERLEDWLSAICYQKLGQKSEQEKALRQIVEFSPKAISTADLLNLFALHELEGEAKAKEFLVKQVVKNPNNPVINWITKAFAGKKEKLSSEITVDENYEVIIEQLGF
ncbi:MAG TPA: DUF5107 domain-containing protein [Pyrinomonadaceae bacterium]|nr:DUF5107 domain-containing protein [Pyrinomonadaceae bacterium]